ncbi:MAG: FtsK/SpoIIIE domain-containing protein [Parcubacteria group bacterium]|jgi:S-DNA-T family DNA segregation ATPase FtsK/SpoIIIE
MENNKEQRIVELERLYSDEDWKEFDDKITIPIGAETETHNLVGTLESGFNLLVGGKSESGKSNFLRCIITSLMKTTSAENLKLILIDTRGTEFSMFDNSAILLDSVVTEAEKAKNVLSWCIYEIENRIKLFSQKKVNSIEEYREKCNKELPRILFIIDEYADLMDCDFWTFDKAILYIVENGQLAGVNIIIGTSKIDVSGGYTKKLAEAFPFRIAFATFTAEESKDILGVPGAEKLQGRGELLMLYPEIETPVRAKGFFVSEYEIEETKEKYNEANIFLPQSFLFKFLWKFYPKSVNYVARYFRNRAKK